MKRYESSEEAYQIKADACLKRFRRIKNKKGMKHRALHHSRQDAKMLKRCGRYV